VECVECGGIETGIEGAIGGSRAGKQKEGRGAGGPIVTLPAELRGIEERRRSGCRK
jgi:hypothetical protein